LGDDAAQAVVDFYNSLSSWERDLENTAPDTTGFVGLVSAGQIGFLAKRLRQTLRPGDIALEKVGEKVPNAELIAMAAIAERDRLFSQFHPNAGKPVRERISLMLSATEEKRKAEAA
jgi:hypothetical protein